jgi:hypothetical protein
VALREAVFGTFARAGGTYEWGDPVDITELILNDHHEQRRMFAQLDDLDRGDTAAVSAIWGRLRVLLEVHAAAEERVFYPELLKLGTGAGSKDSGEAETRDAVHDHNDIRDAIARTDDHDRGGASWWDAVAEVREANSDHMGEEEREALADFRRHASLDLRHDLAVRFATFESEHAQGINAHDTDPDDYVEQRTPTQQG